MIAILALLLLIWAALIVAGFLIKGLLVLGIIGLVLFVATAIGGAIKLTK